MGVQATEIMHGYLLCLLCLPERGSVLLQVGVSAYPLDRAKSKHRLQPRPHAMIYGEMGTLGRARRGLSWISHELASRWPAQDGWVRVPETEGRAFRRLLHTAVDRYSALEAKKAIHHIDLAELSSNYRSMHHSRTKRTKSFLKTPAKLPSI